MQVNNPPAARRDDVVETLHGVAVADPYRWLEDGESDEARSWVESQNARTRAVLESLPNVELGTAVISSDVVLVHVPGKCIG